MVSFPMRAGRYGDFGGRFVPESLMAALDELEREYTAARADPEFAATLDTSWSAPITGRPTPLYFAERLSDASGRARLPQARRPCPHRRA